MGTKKKVERVGFLDIESSNLVADFGFMLSWCIKDGDSKTIYQDVIKKSDINNYSKEEDARITASLIEAMKKFDRLVTYYGARFDIPFIRTRAHVSKLKFPGPNTIKHTDLWFHVRGKFRLSSNRLENASRVLIGKTDKTRVESKHWRRGQRGDQNSLSYILDHNQKDVLDLEKLWKDLIPYFTPSKAAV